MLRMAFSLGVITIVTLALIPVQWLAVRLEWQLRRRIPTFYHRIVCRVLGIRITEIGRRVAGHPLLIVSNHTSWLDISVITAVAPVFVDRNRSGGGEGPRPRC
jgi:1-acyl-sn-glycerol-3-phosphate acyltransferase